MHRILRINSRLLPILSILFIDVQSLRLFFAGKSGILRIISVSKRLPILSFRFASVLVTAALIVAAFTRADDTPANKPSPYQDLIQFVGEEDTGQWSMRLYDTAYRQRATFHLSALWKYQPARKNWEVVDKPDVTHIIVPPNEKPQDGPDDSQILAQLPQLKSQSRGLYFARWEVDGIPGSTFCRLGSASATAHSADEGKPAPKGMIGTVVPLDADHAVFAIIPDPKIACVDDATTQPAGK